MKRDEIIGHLKSRILSGEIPPGSYLPHRAELLEYSEPSRGGGVPLLVRVAGDHGFEDAAAPVPFRDPDPFREPSGGEGLRLPLVVDSRCDG